MRGSTLCFPNRGPVLDQLFKDRGALSNVYPNALIVSAFYSFYSYYRAKTIS